MPTFTVILKLSALASLVANGAAPPAKSTFLGNSASFVQGLKFKQVLRVCNAYPYGAGMDVFLGTKHLTSAPLAYKTCEDYAPEMQPGDRVDFKSGGDSAGTFTISDLPAGDATLLLIIYRHDVGSTAAAFESHAFPRSDATQVAIIDTYKGNVATEIRIEDPKPIKSKAGSRQELLRYDSVVAIVPGLYNVQLVGANGTAAETAEFVAAPKQSYVVVRCGVESMMGKAYPQELMVFPHSDKMALGAAASSFRFSWLAAAVMAMVLLA
jgi:hypothetical protein